MENTNEKTTEVKSTEKILDEIEQIMLEEIKFYNRLVIIKLRCKFTE